MGHVGQDLNTGVDAAWKLKMALRKAKTLETRSRHADVIKQFERRKRKGSER
jgi:hypothetical protein